MTIFILVLACILELQIFLIPTNKFNVIFFKQQNQQSFQFHYIAMCLPKCILIYLPLKGINLFLTIFIAHKSFFLSNSQMIYELIQRKLRCKVSLQNS